MLAALFYLGPEELPPVGRLLIAVGVFAVGAWGLSRRSGRRAGVAFKIR